MNIYQTLAIATTGTVLGFATMIAPAESATFFEVGDAGNSFYDAQVLTGASGEPVSQIQGALLDWVFGESDYFRFLFSGDGTLSIATNSYRTMPSSPPSGALYSLPSLQLYYVAYSEPPMSFMYPTYGVLMGGYYRGAFTTPTGDYFSGSSGTGSFAGGMGSSFSAFFGTGGQLIFSNLPAGEYVLQVDSRGAPGSGYYGGWSQRASYIGSYDISLSGAEAIAEQPIPEPSSNVDSVITPDESVPEPTTMVGTIIAAGVGWLMKKNISSNNSLN